jgi:hypothetical protein
MSGGLVWPVCDLGFVDSSFKYTRDRTGRVPRPQTRARRRRTGPAHRPPRRPPAASPQSAPPHPRTLGTTCPGEPVRSHAGRGGCRFVRNNVVSVDPSATLHVNRRVYTHSNSLEPAGCSLRACSPSSPRASPSVTVPRTRTRREAPPYCCRRAGCRCVSVVESVGGPRRN